MSISILLDQRLTIQRQSVTPDASGGSTRTFTNLLTNIPCAVSSASSAVVADYARRDMVVDSHVYTTAGLDALLSGGLRLGDRITDGTIYYLVKGVMKLSNAAVSNDVIYQADCERRQ